MYDKKYSEISLKENDWLIRRSNLAEFIIKELGITNTDKVLDIGCDDGFMQQKISAASGDIIGIDINKDTINSNLGTKSLFMDATNMDFASASFDKIYSSHTVEHIANLKGLFKEADRVLRPGGKALFVYPWELWRGMAHVRGAWKMCGNPFLGYKFHVHKLNPKKITQFASGTGLKPANSKLIFMRSPQWATLFIKDI